MIKLQGNRWYTDGSREDYIECYKITPYKVRLYNTDYIETHRWCYDNVKGTFSAIVQHELIQCLYADIKEKFVDVIQRQVVWYYFSNRDDAMLFKLIWC